MLNRDWICANIPHRGRMCLLDSVYEWNPEFIECRSMSHRADDHPLRAHDRLGALCGVEYAAQAMAVHGAVLARALPQGFIASVRGLRLSVERLDDIDTALRICCQRINADAQSLIYDFSLFTGQRLLLCGRAAIALGMGRTA